MKILWVSNTVFPDLAEDLGIPVPVVGGWMYGLAKEVSQAKGVSLAVAAVRNDLQPAKRSIGSIDYFLLSGQKSREEYDPSLEKQWNELVADYKPDLVHIHGTEFAPGLSLLKAVPALKSVVSIQGMTSVYSRYYLGGLGTRKILKNITFRDIIKWDTLLHGPGKFHKRGENVEKVYLRTTQNIIGRTQWDHDHVKTINPEGTYHFCNESLRDEFYNSNSWDPEAMVPHSIFLSQALYPIKGLHKVLEAASILKKRFPKLQIRIAGPDITRRETFKDRMRISGYGKIINGLIKKYELQSHITFTGPLNASGMVSEYLRANAFVCPSSIENSPNSLGEAQLLGVPCVSSYVGGVPTMAAHEDSALLYRFEEVEMMAQHLSRIFTDQKLAEGLSLRGKEVASIRHDRKTNGTRTLEIYRRITQQNQVNS